MTPQQNGTFDATLSKELKVGGELFAYREKFEKGSKLWENRVSFMLLNLVPKPTM